MAKANHHLAVASVIDAERLQELRRARHHRFIKAAEADLNGARLHTGAVKHIPETHPGPDRVAHRTICPLSTGYAWNGVDARIAGALVDRGDIKCRQSLQNILERQREGLIDPTPDRQTKAIHIDVARKSRPVPADVMLVVWGEHALVENLERRLKPWRARTLQDHSALLRIGCGDYPRARTAQHVQIDRLLRQGRRGHERQAAYSAQHTPSRQPR